MRLVCIICGADPSTQAIAVYRVNNKGQSGRFACRADFDEARALFPNDNPDAPAPAKSDDDASMKELGFWTGGYALALVRDLLFGPFKGVSVCTFCGSKENVLCYPPTREERIAWNARHNCKYPNEKCDEFEPTFCPECCPMQIEGHEFTYDRSDQQYTCDNCGDFPPGDWQGYYCDDGY